MTPSLTPKVQLAVFRLIAKREARIPARLSLSKVGPVQQRCGWFRRRGLISQVCVCRLRESYPLCNHKSTAISDLHVFNTAQPSFSAHSKHAVQDITSCADNCEYLRSHRSRRRSDGRAASGAAAFPGLQVLASEGQRLRNDMTS